MLSNFQGDERILLQIMLVGQPELKRRLITPGLSQLKQRIGVHFHLGALTREETGMYIRFRLEHAGGGPGLFTTRAVTKIFDATSGIPRAINLLCDAALVYGFADELNPIDLPVLERVLADQDISGGGSLPTALENKAETVLTKKIPVYSNGRLEKLETELMELRADVFQRLLALEKNHATSKTIENLDNLLAEERRKSAALQDRCALLEQQISILRAHNRKMRSKIADTIQADE
jgi:general secretion pathway protein A